MLYFTHSGERTWASFIFQAFYKVLCDIWRFNISWETAGLQVAHNVLGFLLGDPSTGRSYVREATSCPAAGGQCSLCVSTDEITARDMTIRLKRALKDQAGDSQCWAAVTFLLFRFELFPKHGPEWIRSGAVEAELRGREPRKENNRP